MAISLSELTGASTSGNVLNEVNSYADFLDSVPRLVNKADPSGATDAVQTVATKQPIALPLIDGEGYLFLSGVAGNYAEADSPLLPTSSDFDVSVDLYKSSTGNRQTVFGQYESGNAARFFVWIDASDYLGIFWAGNNYSSSTIVPEGRNTIRVTKVGDVVTVYLNGVEALTKTRTEGIAQVNFQIGTYIISGVSYEPFKGAIFSVTEANGLFDIDFTSPRIPHGASEFECETGQVVTVNTSGNNPAKVIKKPVLRYDGVDDFMDGVFGQTLSSGYLFAAFSVNGDGGSGLQYNRIIGLNSAGGLDSGVGSVAFRRNASTNGLMIRYNGLNLSTHSNFFDDERGDYLLEAKVQDGSQQSKVNNADADNGVGTITGDLSAEEFKIAVDTSGGNATSIDLEYLALFPASITDAQADQVRSFINNRNKVFYRWDTDGYYFFDGAATDDGQVFTGSGSWNGRIVGSDNGDADFYIYQDTLDDRPTTDGYKITFSDNTDHFDIPSTTQAGWQIVGTSLGTFAYKVNANTQTELNLLGYRGESVYRKAGDLYGIILLPQSATNRDIEEARKLLIDRGAADGTTSGSIFTNWYNRDDIVEFKHIDTSSVTYAPYAFFSCGALSSFPALDLSNCDSFTNAWQGCSSLTQFPQDAKLGTEVTGSVSFASAWQSSGLQSFSTPLPTATNLSSAFQDCTQLAAIGQLQTSNVTNWFYTFYNCHALEEVPVLDTANGTEFFGTWRNCRSLTQFPLLNCNSGRRFSWTWNGCSALEDFPAGFFNNWNPTTGISDAPFGASWHGCTSLTAQSVENILTSIAASGKWATTNGLEGGTALTDATIDIDYNVATGSLTAATLSAIETLNGRGWSVNINNEIIVPNILQLQPAAAYSLRSFDADADPTVVNVRRSSDGALSDFTASQVSDGTLTDWVNNVVTISPTLNNGGFEDGATGWTLGSATTIDSTVSHSGSNSAKLNVVGGAYTFLQRAVSPLEVGKEVTVGFWAKTSDASKALNVNLGVSTHLINFTTTDWEYKEITRVIYTNTTMIFARSGSGDFTIHIDDITVTNLTADGYVTTFYDQSSNGNDSTQSTASSQPLIVENGVLVTEGGEAALDFQTEVSNLSLNHSDLYGQATLDSFYVTITSDTTYSYPALVNTTNAYGMVSQPLDTSSPTSLFYGSPAYYANSIQLTSATRDSIYQATYGGQKLVAHIGADTTNVNWSTHNMNFGNLNNNTLFGYTGKLQEMIFFNTDQSANRVAIQNNINDHFNIYS